MFIGFEEMQTSIKYIEMTFEFECCNLETTPVSILSYVKVWFHTSQYCVLLLHCTEYFPRKIFHHWPSYSLNYNIACSSFTRRETKTRCRLRHRSGQSPPVMSRGCSVFIPSPYNILTCNRHKISFELAPMFCSFKLNHWNATVLLVPPYPQVLGLKHNGDF